MRSLSFFIGSGKIIEENKKEENYRFRVIKKLYWLFISSSLLIFVKASLGYLFTKKNALNESDLNYLFCSRRRTRSRHNNVQVATGRGWSYARASRHKWSGRWCKTSRCWRHERCQWCKYKKCHQLASKLIKIIFKTGWKRSLIGRCRRSMESRHRTEFSRSSRHLPTLWSSENNFIGRGEDVWWVQMKKTFSIKPQSSNLGEEIIC